MREIDRRHEAWLRRGAVAAVLLISWLLLPAVQKEVFGLHRFSLKKFRVRAFVVKELSTPLSGERYVLSGPTLAMLSLLRAHQPETYRCSEAISASAYGFQRLVESAWPIRYDAGSSIEVSLLSEATACVVLGEQRLRNKKTSEEHGVRLAVCR